MRKKKAQELRFNGGNTFGLGWLGAYKEICMDFERNKRNVTAKSNL